MKKKILMGLGGAGLFGVMIAILVAVHQLTIAGTVTKPYTFSAGQTIKASETNANYDTIYNEFNGNIDNNNVKAAAGIAQTKIDDYSATTTQMQTTVDPGDVGTESPATNLQGEIERLRFKIKQIIGGAQWYSDTPIAKGSLPAAVAYEDEANVFTQANQFEKIKLDDVSGTAGFMVLQNNGGSIAFTNLGDTAEIVKWDGTGKMIIGTVPLARIDGFTGSLAYDAPLIGIGQRHSFDITVTGAAVGDFVLVSVSAEIDARLILTARVTSANTVRVTISNTSDDLGIDAGSTTYSVKVIKKDF